jgi:hypothetical protein
MWTSSVIFIFWPNSSNRSIGKIGPIWSPWLAASGKISGGEEERDLLQQSELVESQSPENSCQATSTTAVSLKNWIELKSLQEKNTRDKYEPCVPIQS